MGQLSRKDNFLLEMYKEQFKHIDRHINLSWQSVGVVATLGALAVATYRFGVPAIISSILGIFICCWSIAKLYDATHWYERHIHIISNIENHFLEQGDDKAIHFYFVTIRTQANTLEWIELQKISLYGLWVLSILFYVFYSWPHGVSSLKHSFCFCVLLLFSGGLFSLLTCYKKHNLIAIDCLRKESPGIDFSKKDQYRKQKEDVSLEHSLFCQCIIKLNKWVRDLLFY